jgi:hypothetical protein
LKGLGHGVGVRDEVLELDPWDCSLPAALRELSVQIGEHGATDMALRVVLRLARDVDQAQVRIVEVLANPRD